VFERGDDSIFAVGEALQMLRLMVILTFSVKIGKQFGSKYRSIMKLTYLCQLDNFVNFICLSIFLIMKSFDVNILQRVDKDLIPVSTLN